MATVERKRKHAGESFYYLQIRYGSTDAKATLKRYVKKHSEMAKCLMTHDMLMNLFSNEALGFLPRRNALPLANWLFEQSLRNEYILEVPKVWVTDEQEYIISPDILKDRHISA